MQHYEFEVILAGISTITDDLEEKLGAKCNDALLESCAGVVSLTFTRTAKTLQLAIDSAFGDIKEAGYLPVLAEGHLTAVEQTVKVLSESYSMTKNEEQELLVDLAEAAMGLLNACQIIRESPKGGEPWEVLCDAEAELESVLDIYLGNV
jgi:hypothetical protein